MAAARLRKTFRYPDDSEQEPEGREELDEEGLDLTTPTVGSTLMLPLSFGLRTRATYQRATSGER